MSGPIAVSAERIHPLTSLRFFAAFYVVIFHLFKSLVSTAHDSFGTKFISLGFTAVSFFFLLSGYILAFVYLRGDRRVDKRRFFASRFARIYPLYLVTLLADTPYSLHNTIASRGVVLGLVHTVGDLLMHLGMVHAWVPRHQTCIDVPNWSLSVEAFFYLSFPLLGAILWKLKGSRLWITAFLLYCGGQTLVWIMYPHLSLRVARFNPLFHLSTFALGICLARWQSLRVAERGSAASSIWVSYGVLALAATGFLAAVQYSPFLSVADLSDGLLAPVFVCVIWALSGPSTAISRLLSMSWLVILGESSYGLYLIHFPVLNIFTYFNLFQYPASSLIYVVLSILLSVLSFYYLETPTRKWLLNRFNPRSGKTMLVESGAR